MNSPVASSVITTRSDWQSCIFCTNKTYKKDWKLHKVEYCGKISRHGRSRAFGTLFSTNDQHVVWFQTAMVTSIKDCRRYIPVHELCKSLNSVVCNTLPVAHAITGCDTTSSFFGIGNKIYAQSTERNTRSIQWLINYISRRRRWFGWRLSKTDIKVVWSEEKVKTL